MIVDRPSSSASKEDKQVLPEVVALHWHGQHRIIEDQE